MFHWVYQDYSIWRKRSSFIDFMKNLWVWDNKTFFFWFLCSSRTMQSNMNGSLPPYRPGARKNPLVPLSQSPELANGHRPRLLSQLSLQSLASDVYDVTDAGDDDEPVGMATVIRNKLPPFVSSDLELNCTRTKTTAKESRHATWYWTHQIHCAHSWDNELKNPREVSAYPCIPTSSRVAPGTIIRYPYITDILRCT